MAFFNVYLAEGVDRSSARPVSDIPLNIDVPGVTRPEDAAEILEAGLVQVVSDTGTSYAIDLGCLHGNTGAQVMLHGQFPHQVASTPEEIQAIFDKALSDPTETFLICEHDEDASEE